MTPNLDRVVDGILESYRDIGGINHLDGPNLPSQQSIGRIVEELQSLIFPGFRAEENLDLASMRYAIGEKVVSVFRALSVEVEKSLRYTCRIVKDCGRHQDCRGEAEELVRALLDDVPGIRRKVGRDVDAACRGDPAARSSEEVILSYPGVEAIMVHRIAHDLWTREVAMIPRMMSEYIHGKTGIDIHPGASIGDNVKLYQGVTLGALSVRKELANRKRHPTLEDDVTVYAGATILGGDTVIGRGSTIGGNVWLTTSVPPGSHIYHTPTQTERVPRAGDG